MLALLRFPSDTRTGDRTRTARRLRDFKSESPAIPTNDLAHSQSVGAVRIVRAGPVKCAALTAEVTTTRPPCNPERAAGTGRAVRFVWRRLGGAA